VFEKHLRAQIDGYFSLLKNYHTRETDYDNEYHYSLSEDEKQLIDEKCSIVEECLELKEKELMDLGFKLMHYIHEGRIDQSFSSLGFKLMEEIPLYKHTLHMPTWSLRTKLNTNGGHRGKFPQFRYIAIYLLHKELEEESGDYPSSKSDKEALRKQINRLRYREATDWFDVSKPEFIRAKNQIKRNI